MGETTNAPGADGAPGGNGVAVTLTPEELATVREAARSWQDVPPAATSRPGTGRYHPDLGAIETRGHLPGQKYVRVVRPQREGFERVAPGWLQATPRATAPTGGVGRFTRRVRRMVLGTPLRSAQLAHERLTKVKALAVLSSDALSSVAYATEQILQVLVAAGVAAFTFALPIMGAITFLLIAVVLSYRQTIRAYPKGGGSYIVAKDNLGDTPGLIAASALMTDYVLTVAVSVASGYDQIQSAWPGAAEFRVIGCVAMVALIALGNLRGLRESGSIFALPTYLFIGSMLFMIATILVRLATGTLSSHPPTQLYPTLENLSIFLVLRAFSSGCSAMTGVEAISDGVLAFKQPEWRNARITISVMGALLAVMFVGVTISAHILGVVAYDNGPNSPYTLHNPCQLGAATCHHFNDTYSYQSVISQLAHAAFGGNALYLLVIVATTLVLILAANTAFSDFPRLLYFLARDDFAPHQFSKLGDRLAYSNGIIALATLACVLLWVFSANVNSLISLYAIGVFLAFTMSQAGMVKRWLTRREPGWSHSWPLNFVGMVMTFVVFVVTASSKFTSGAWVIIVIVPCLVLLFKGVHRHYHDISGQVTTEIPTSPGELKAVCIVPIADFGQVALQSLAMARTISDDVIAVHVCDDEQHIARLRAKWEAWGGHIPLEIVESPYRSLVRPLLAYINAVDRQRDNDTVVVVLPELVATRWWQQLLHNQNALRLKAALLFRPGTVVVNVPYHLSRPRARVGRRHRSDDPEAI